MQLKFENVKGYKTYENAVKRGQQLEDDLKDACSFRWVVISLPNGRFTPMVLANDSVQPTWVTHFPHCCIGN